jgi:hypothetical protein
VHVRAMIQRSSEANERAREKPRSIAKRYGLGDASMDFHSTEEVWEALHQFDMGLLPERLTSQKSN